MASMQADGGIVSTVEDLSSFATAFFTGQLFEHRILDEIQSGWHRIFFPLQYGTGIMRFPISRLLTSGRSSPALVGHAGANGTVLFRDPDGLTVVGTVSQAAHRALPFRLLTRTALAARSLQRSGSS